MSHPHPNSPNSGHSFGIHSAKSIMSTDPVLEKDGVVGAAASTGVETKVSQRRKWMLLLIFSISSYLDICGRSAFIVFVQTISRDLNIKDEDSIWILNSYGVTFGSFLLAFGRISDLYSAKPVFVGGFLFCAIASLISSFMTEKVSFFIFRGLYGVAASATIPSAFRLILAVFEPHEVHKALAFFGLSAALANATGLLWGGVFGEIETTVQQNVSWRWYSRWVCIVSIPFAIFSQFMIPSTRGPNANMVSKWKYLDIVGNFLILASVLIFNVALTLGAANGWDSAQFIVTIVISAPLAIAFFIWEWKIDEKKAVLPPSLWKLPNVALVIFVTMYLFSWVADAQLPFVQRFEVIEGESLIMSAVRMLPLGLGSAIFLLLASPIIKKLSGLKHACTLGFAICAAAYVPLIYSGGTVGSNYWKYLFPAFLIGSFGLAIAYLTCNVTVMTAVPPAKAGTAGALFQLAVQLGVVTGYSIQDALFSVHEGGVLNWENVQISFWFQFGWGALCTILVLVLFRQMKNAIEKAEEIAMTPTRPNGNRV